MTELKIKQKDKICL